MKLKLNDQTIHTNRLKYLIQDIEQLVQHSTNNLVRKKWQAHLNNLDELRSTVSDLWMIDFEGTLTDNRWRQHLITGPDKDWREYYKGLEKDPMIEWIYNLIRWLPMINVDVIIYTTRMPNKYNMERQWLTAHNLPTNNLVMRANTKLPGPQLLRQWCEAFKPVAVVDDRPDNRNAVIDIVPAVYSPEEILNIDLEDTNNG